MLLIVVGQRASVKIALHIPLFPTPAGSVPARHSVLHSYVSHGSARLHLRSSMLSEQKGELSILLVLIVVFKVIS
jgi:hypothetical protein